jgi:membrane-bound ClpP family serine protease
MDEVFGAAIIAVIVIFVIVGAVRVILRRPTSTDKFGAGGRSTVPVGTPGFVKTPVAPTGVVTAVGEDWSATSRTGEALAMGAAVTVVGQDGLTVIVEAAPTAAGSVRSIERQGSPGTEA